jgi:RNA polymerase sigma factor (sigma-70 family)
MLDDHQLLCRYVVEDSEAAFAELVGRYVNLVYSTALRRIGGDADLAKDVAQLVFTDLACKARFLPSDILLAGWLHRATRYAAGQLLRTEHRRKAREHEAATMNALTTEPAPDWEQIRPLLDEALDRLNRTDRDALLLRFFEQHSLAEIGRALGTNEDAARKRVSRALEKLRADLVRRGVTTTAAVLSTAISVNAVQVAPVGLTAVLTSASLAGALAGSGTTLALLRIMATTKLKLGIASALVVAGVVTPLVLQHLSLVKLREQNQALQQQGELAAQLSTENARLSNLVAQASSARTQDDARLSELLRLRGEVGLLRKLTNELGRLKEENRSPAVTPQPEAVVPKESWAFAGYATPEAALQTVMWAMKQGDVTTFLASLSPEMQKSLAQQFGGKPENEIAAQLSQEVAPVAALRLDRQEVAADGAVTFTLVSEQHDNGAVRTSERAVLTFRNVGGEWKEVSVP